MSAAASTVDPLANLIEKPAALNAPQALIDLLLGQRAASALTTAEARAIDQSSAFHGVDGLVWQQLRTHGVGEQPEFSALARRARLQAQWELSHRAAVVDLLARCEQADIPVLLLKGTALAYGTYTAPAMRSRGDTDLLIDPSDQQRMNVVLTQAGFHSVGASKSSDLQAGFERVDSSGARQVIDLHWQVNNSPLLAGIWSFTELVGRARRLPKLSVEAMGLAKVDALIHACLHWLINRQTPYHYGAQTRIGGDRLIWLYDIQLLAQSCDADDLSDLSQQLSDKRLASLCLPALSSARASFPTSAMAELVRLVSPMCRVGCRSWAFNGGWLRRSAAELLFRSNRGTYLHELLWAPTGALRDRYPNDRRSIPVLQVQRWLDGINRRRRRQTKTKPTRSE